MQREINFFFLELYVSPRFNTYHNLKVFIVFFVEKSDFLAFIEFNLLSVYGLSGEI